jgi:hypothetical protein
MLPRGARERLAQPLREACEEAQPLRASHTLPIEVGLWGWYSDGLVERLRELAAGLEHFPSDTSFGSLSKHVESVVASRSRALSVLYALEPFAPFDRDIAQRILQAVDTGLSHAATALEDGTEPLRPLELWRTCNEWPRGPSVDTEITLSQLFGLDEEPVDDIGDFRPGWVLEAYKYDAAGLLNQLAPHLSALGLPLTRDVLAMTSVIGWVSGAPDPLVAYVSMDSLTNKLSAASPALTDQVLGYFRQRERGRHQARRRLLRTIATAAASDDAETRALATADIYRRLVEGVVRQFGWALRCLQIGAWSAPPVLTRVRDAMPASGSLARRIAEDAVLVSMRNGEAHEDLEWDGVHDHYVVDGEAIARDRVAAASVIALSFDRGCEAALAYHRATRLPVREAAPTPSPDDPFSMPAWQRAEAYFGSNGLRLLRSELNVRTARVWLQALESGQINPCFQALISVQQLLPAIEAFEVYIEGRNEKVIEVSASALAVNVPAWTQALEIFDVMPIVTFLPANFAARSEVEPASKASRSAAWIAADGVLDALDGGPESLDESGVTLLVDRLRLVETAAEHCLRLMPAANQTRLRSVLAAVRELLDGIAELRARPLDILAIEALQPVGRIRHFWSAWGPVKRHPNVPESPPPAHVHERLPGRRKDSLPLHL